MTAIPAPLNDDAPLSEDIVPERELIARRLTARLEEASALEILDHAINDAFAGKIALVSSFGAESAALLSLVAEINPATPVIFLETGKHFAQTLSYRRKLAKKLGLSDVRDIRPNAEALAERDASGDLWKRDADACCSLRKVEPLADALSEFDAWITGRKQFHGEGRINLPAFEANDTHIKVNPLIRWTKDDVSAYMADKDLPAHALVAQGYPSIGCWPCTHPVADGEDIRAGRWRGSAKTECGIHGR